MKAVFVCAIAGLVGSASAGIFSETELNDTLGLANDLGAFDVPGGSVVINGAIDATPGATSDVDWFSFTLNNTASLAVFAAFSADDGDGVMQIVAAGGDVIAFDDDSGVGLMPAVQLNDLAAGTYFVGISGFGDADSTSVDTDELLDGIGHDENFAYKLTVGLTIVPSPASLAMLGMGGLVAARRRR